MNHVAVQLPEGSIEDLRRLLKGLPAHRQLKRYSFAVQGQDRPKERLRVLVVLPALVPEYQRQLPLRVVDPRLQLFQVQSHRKHQRAFLQSAHRLLFAEFRKVIQKSGKGIEKRAAVKLGVKDNAVGAQHGGVIDESVVEITFPVLTSHRSAFRIFRQRIGQLVLVHVKDDRSVGGSTPREGQKSAHIQHVGRHDHIGLEIRSRKLPSQGHRSTMHSPLPVAGRQRQKGNVVGAVFLVTLGPRLVAASMVGRDEQHLHDRAD